MPTPYEDLSAELEEAERYAQDLERDLSACRPAAQLTWLRGGIGETVCVGCRGTRLRWFHDRASDEAHSRPCDRCLGPGNPCTLERALSAYHGWIEGLGDARDLLEARGVKLGPAHELPEGVVRWTDCAVPQIDVIDDLWGTVVWGLEPDR